MFRIQGQGLAVQLDRLDVVALCIVHGGQVVVPRKITGIGLCGAPVLFHGIPSLAVLKIDIAELEPVDGDELVLGPFHGVGRPRGEQQREHETGRQNGKPRKPLGPDGGIDLPDAVCGHQDQDRHERQAVA